MNPISESRTPARNCLFADHDLPSPVCDEGCFRLEDRRDVDYAGLSLPASGTDLRVRPTLEPRFVLGRFYITANAARALPAAEVLNALARHADGDWGLLDAHDRQQNERALRDGGRLFSVYQASTGQRLYVITDAGHEVTTVLLPEDY